MYLYLVLRNLGLLKEALIDCMHLCFKFFCTYKVATSHFYFLKKIMITTFALLSLYAAQAVEADPELACSAEEIDEYNFGWRLASAFIIFAVTLLASFFAVYISRMKRSKFLERGLLVMKLFGIGIIAGTAWMHLLPEAFKSFASECLSGGWEEYGPAYVGLFAFIAASLVQLIEIAGHSHANSEAHLSTHEKPFEEDCETEITKQISAVILEFGILFHSFIIGITLGVSTDSVFVSLFVAIAFHQIFEALALGLVVADTTMKANTKYILALLYPLATPIGIAVGIAARGTYNENANAVLVVRGIFNSISAGILMYNTYAELVAFHMTHNETLKKEINIIKTSSYLAFYCGASAMAVIANWA